MARSVLLAHISAFVSGTAVATTPPIDTTGATALYVFGASTFTMGVAPGGTDNKANAFVQFGDPNSSCNGSIISWRCFNPTTTGPGHTFSVSGSPSFSTYIAVLALTLKDPGAAYLLTRTASKVKPCQPGSMTPPADDFVIVAAAVAGCGWGPLGGGIPAVDSGFTLIEAVGSLGVALQVQAKAAPINPTWSTLTPEPIFGETGCAVMEGMGFFPPFGSGLRVYEA